MAKVNRALYEAARRRIAAGRWTVDAISGIVIGTYGKPIGYPNHWGYPVAPIYRGGGTNQLLGIVYLHRVIWEHANGPIPDGLEINHKNGVKTDNRLANLEAVTPSENSRDVFRQGLKNMKGSHHPKAKLTEQAAREIRAGLAAGENRSRLARLYDVHPSTIDAIRDGRTWRHIG